jgi:hypothetical protein
MRKATITEPKDGTSSKMCTRRLVCKTDAAGDAVEDVRHTCPASWRTCQSPRVPHPYRLVSGACLTDSAQRSKQPSCCLPKPSTSRLSPPIRLTSSPQPYQLLACHSLVHELSQGSANLRKHTVAGHTRCRSSTRARRREDVYGDIADDTKEYEPSPARKSSSMSSLSTRYASAFTHHTYAPPQAHTETHNDRDH